MSRFHRASLAEPPPWGVYFASNLARSPDDWEHTGDLWRLTIYGFEGWIEYRGHRFPFSKGTVVTLPPRSHFKQDRYGADLDVLFSNFKLADSDQEVMALPLLAQLGEDYELRKADWTRCISRASISPIPFRANMFHLLWLIAKPLAKYRKHSAVDEAEFLFEQRLHEPISMGDVAKEIGISQNQLIRLFRQEHGLTPVGYLRNRRAEEARRLLIGGTMPIKEIAARVGVPNLHYFNSFVREYYGCGPRELRERERA